MKKITPVIVAMMLLTSVSGYASSHGMKHHMDGEQKHKQQKHGKGHIMAMKHANPLPNFMKIIKKHGDQLALNEKQSAALAAWRKNNNKVVHDLANAVMAAEKALHDAAFTDASQAELQDLMDKALHLRLQLAQRKMRCRDNMRSILNENQWQKVVSLYQKMTLAKK